ncbi:MAG: 4Fe-4S ferredoxin [Bacteroidales bacterium]|nr:MAG: 4Fe-4S ferredoxin [Bacteroidales bacterium]
MIREIVKIDEEKCNGCGICVPNCQEGALQIIDGKARLISDLFCDGLGACLGHCPEGAITIEKREAEPYDEIKVMEMVSKQGYNTIIAHLKHLKHHDEFDFVKQAMGYLKANNYDVEAIRNELHQEEPPTQNSCGGCQGSKTIDLRATSQLHSHTQQTSIDEQASELRQWPVQMHLINPMASYFKGANLVVAADCVAFSLGNFHSHYLRGNSLAIACPKLDSNKEIYIEKLVSLIENAKVNTITVMIMEVPCCGGLWQLVQIAIDRASRKVPIKMIVVGISGNIISEEWK